MMKAARISRYGDADVIRIDDVPVPDPKGTEVRIRVAATSVNPVDCKLRSGTHRAVVRWKLPHTLGLDVSGVVDAVGPRAKSFRVGDRVFSSPSHSHEGTSAEFVCVPEGEVALAPTSISLADAAALPLVALTAWACLVDTAKLASGEKLLVMNGSGGVGSVAVQMGRAFGADVSTTCSSRSAELLRSLGAAHTVDYRSQKAADVLAPQDVVLVGIGGAGIDEAHAASRKGARIAAIVGDMPEYVERYGPVFGAMAAGLGMLRHRMRGVLRGRTVRHVVRASDGVALAKIAALVDEGKLKPVIDSRFHLDRLADAHRHLEEGHAVGKVVVDVTSL
jgi:NADPH:quinone reductase-like Zn-dependent oxidoreductase